jgi:mono/diheme cytochrome c family protein
MKSVIASLAVIAVAVCIASATAVADDAQQGQSNGQVAYERVCKVCHGNEGRGDAAPRLVPFDRTIDEVRGIVRDGRGEMPPISERRLKDEEISEIVEYLKALSKA